MSGNTPSAHAAFESVDLATWRAQVESELRGTPFESLLRTTADGGIVQPVYVEASAEHAPLLTRRAWLQAPRVSAGDVVAENRALLADLVGGCGGFWLMADCASLDANALGQLLDGVQLAAVEVHAEAYAEPAEMLDRLQQIGGSEPLHGSLGADLYAQALRGMAAAEFGADALAALVQRCATEVPGMRALAVSSEPLSDAGAYAVQELGYLLASTAAHWRALEECGVAPSTSLAQTVWRMTVGRDTFGGLAALRAARLLGRRLAELCGVEGEPIVHAICARRCLQTEDASTNLLRTTTQVYAALLGGADVLTISAWDEATEDASLSARRLARNTALVLAEEGGLDAVADPAAGSGFLEARTEQLAADAWAWFRAVESRGGVAAVLADGSLHAEIAETARVQRKRVDGGLEPILGVTVYPPKPGEAGS
jgi:methylmalonyl-CoA mutase